MTTPRTASGKALLNFLVKDGLPVVNVSNSIIAIEAEAVAPWRVEAASALAVVTAALNDTPDWQESAMMLQRSLTKALGGDWVEKVSPEVAAADRALFDKARALLAGSEGSDER